VYTASRSHRRLTVFVGWIQPDSETRGQIVKQAGEIRSAVAAQAKADGLAVVDTPDSGSFAKGTGLRRHMRGHSDVEGQDVDLPFVVRPATADGEKISELLRRFDGYASKSYPTTERKITASSVELRFAASKLNYDLVPMLRTDKPDYQRILKKDGSTRITSVPKHTEFIRNRSAKSALTPGPVAFNQCVRLFKWWRETQLGKGGAIKEVRTTLIDLLCAAAFDVHNVKSTYTETLGTWFSYLAHVTSSRQTIRFKDYPSIEPLNESTTTNRLWAVLDPVNENNNVVHSEWTNIELSEFAEWFSLGRDHVSRIMSNEFAGNESAVDEDLVELFGNPVITHGELA
jgi:hypothetical protein